MTDSRILRSYIRDNLIFNSGKRSSSADLVQFQINNGIRISFMIF